MANGYGSSTPPPSPSSARQSAANVQAQVAPPGFHYMPDGTLMSDAQHAALYNTAPPVTPIAAPTTAAIITSPPPAVAPILATPTTGTATAVKAIKNFNINLGNLPASKSVRSFIITGDQGAVFSLEIKNEDNHYYNFNTQLFQVSVSRLSKKTIPSGGYRNSIYFPAVTDDDQYDIYLYSESGTIHSEYQEVRFGDGTVDINKSQGSNSYLMQKVIHQYAADLQLKLDVNQILYIELTNPNVNSSAITFSTHGRGTTKTTSSFSLPFSVNSLSTAFQIIKQPTISDIFAYNRFAIGDAETLPGENAYPTVSNTDTVDGAITGGGSDIKVVMDTDVADKLVVGDKITAAVATDTVDGAVSSGIKVVMDNNVAGKMAIGDRITGTTFLTSNLVTVAALNPDGDNAKEFSMSEAVALDDGATLTFNPKCNRSLTTVVALDPDGDNTKEFSMSQNIGLVDGVTLSLSNQKNQRFSLSTVVGISEGQSILVDETTAAINNTVANSLVSKYRDTTVVFEGTEQEQTIVKNQAPAIDYKGQKPTITKGELDIQPGSIVFSNQQPLLFASGTYNIGGFGNNNIKAATGYSLSITNLKITPTPITVTTTSAVNDSAVIPVTSVNGVIDNITTVSGVGINSAVASPTIISRSVTSGAGNITLDSTQNLEKGITLTLSGSSQTVTITGDIQMTGSPTSQPTAHNVARTLYFDLDKLVSIV